MVEMNERSRELARGFLEGDPIFYSVLRARGPESTMICRTESDGSNSFFEIIRYDEALEALAAYLKELGVPVFEDRRKHDKFLDAFEGELKLGYAPADARAVALGAAFPDDLP